MIAKAVKGSIKNTYHKKIRLHRREYEWTCDGGLISNYEINMLYLILKIIKPNTRIAVSNLKYEIDKSILAKFLNIVKDILDDMSSSYSIIIDKGECNDDYAR